MKAVSALFFAAVLSGLSITSVVTPARADADDAAWIAAYCSCMNGKMSSSETLSVSAWEKTHPTEMAACDKEAGWK